MMILETLERRLAPAGVVTVVLSGGVVKLSGDFEDNEVTVSQGDAGAILVTGNNGTLIAFGGTEGESALVTGAVKGLTIDMKAGSDQLVLEGLGLTGNVAVQMGADDNAVRIAGETVIGGNLTVRGLGGEDILVVEGALKVGGKTAVLFGDGYNQLTIAAVPNIEFGKGLSYVGGRDNDELSLRTDGTFFVGGSLEVSLGAETGRVDVAAQFLEVRGSLRVVSAVHPDAVSVVLEAGVVEIGGSVVLRSGGGAAETILAVADVMRVGGSFTVVNGGDASGSTVDIDAQRLSVAGSFSITNAAGYVTMSVQVPDLYVGGNFSLANGAHEVAVTAATATTVLQFQTAVIGGGLTIVNKTGAFQSDIQGQRLEVGHGIRISQQGALEGVTNNMSLVVVELETTAISIVNGRGGFGTLVDSAHGVLTRGLTVSNGASAVDGSHTTTLISGDWDMGGGMAILNGRGHYDTTVANTGLTRLGGGITVRNGATGVAGDETETVTVINTPGTLELGGSLTIDNGRGLFRTQVLPGVLVVGGSVRLTNGDTGSAAGGTLNAVDAVGLLEIGGSLVVRNGRGEFLNGVDAEVLRIRGSLTISNGVNVGGPAGETVSTLTGGSLTIGGALVVSNGGGASTNTNVSAGLVSVGSVAVRNGAGDDVFQMAVTGLSVRGSVVVDHGDGASITDLNVITASGFSVRGDIEVTAGAGEDLLVITGAGWIGGDVRASFGRGYVARLDMMSSVLLDSGAATLSVGGAVTLGAAAESLRNMELLNVSLAQGLTVNGGAAGDSVLIRNSWLGGPVKLNLLGGDDNVEITHTVFRKGFTWAGGEGADTLRVEWGSEDFMASQFYGAVRVLGGGGDDSVFIGEPSSGKVFFFDAVTLDGGAGEADTLATVITETPIFNEEPRFLGGRPVVRGFEVLGGGV